MAARVSTQPATFFGERGPRQLRVLTRKLSEAFA